MNQHPLYIYTDGACSKNGSKDAIAGIGIYFSSNDPRNRSIKLDGFQTNNTAELQAILQTYPLIKNETRPIVIATDSKYAILCATSYGKKNADTNWITDIPNKQLVHLLYTLFKRPNVSFMHVPAHTGGKDIHSIGNDNADRLANMAIGQQQKEEIKTRTYLNVPYARKDECKELGGRWDPAKKKWYVPEGVDAKEFLDVFDI